MLTLDFEALSFELKEGALKHVGASNTAATAKLYDATDVEARAFGDERVKLAVADREGNEVEIALFPEQARTLRADLDALEADSDLFE